VFPELSPTTVDIKGHEKPLIHRGLLTDSDTYSMDYDTSAARGTIGVKPVSAQTEDGPDTPRDQVAYSLQIEGVKYRKNKYKFFRFFGISKDAETDINAMIDAVINAVIEAST
jgi:hypothetical protein